MLSYNEAIELFQRLEQEDEWLDWCIRHNVFTFYTKEYAAELSKIIKERIDNITAESGWSNSDVNIIEIAAGNGILSSGLKEEGIEIIPTDIDPSSPGVEKISAADALKKYGPEIIVVSWLPIDADIEKLLLQYPTVRYLLYIYQETNISAGSPYVWQAESWERTSLYNADRFSLCRYDFTFVQGEIVKHSKALLLKKLF